MLRYGERIPHAETLASAVVRARSNFLAALIFTIRIRAFGDTLPDSLKINFPSRTLASRAVVALYAAFAGTTLSGFWLVHQQATLIAPQARIKRSWSKLGLVLRQAKANV